jgi:hypothetical protein
MRTLATHASWRSIIPLRIAKYLPVPVLDPGALILPLGPSNWVLPPTRFGRFFQMGHISLSRSKDTGGETVRPVGAGELGRIDDHRRYAVEFIHASSILRVPIVGCTGVVDDETVASG